MNSIDYTINLILKDNNASGKAENIKKAIGSISKSIFDATGNASKQIDEAVNSTNEKINNGVENTLGGIKNKIRNLTEEQLNAPLKKAIALEKEINLLEQKQNKFKNQIIIGATDKAGDKALDSGKNPGLKANNPKFNENGTLIPITIKLDNNSLNKANTSALKGVNKIKKNVQITAEQTSKILTDGVTSVMSYLGTALSKGEWMKTLRSMLLVPIDMLKQFGSAVVAAGFAALALKMLLHNPLLAIAAGAGLVLIASFAKAQISKKAHFANGGIVSGPTLALVGEYSGASNNPEVIAPLDRLRNLIRPSQDFSQMEFRIRGTDLVAISSKVNNINLRTR